MNILHVCPNYYPSKGGPQYTLKNISEKFVEYYSDSVEVVTTNSYFGSENKIYKKIERSYEKINGVAVHRLSFPRWHYPLIKYTGKIKAKITGKGWPYSISKFRFGMHAPSIDRRLMNSQVDVIMATTVIYNFCNYPLVRLKKNPKPFILYGAMHLHKEITVDDIAIKRAKACDCYIANTEFEKNILIEYGIESKKIKSIGTGIAPEDYTCNEKKILFFKRKYKIKDSDILVGYIGRLVKGKGVGLLLAVFKKISLSNSSIKLLLAGASTEYVPEIKKTVEREKLPVILIENFEDNDKAILHNVIDIFVLASQSESFGVVLLEAWACKKTGNSK